MNSRKFLWFSLYFILAVVAFFADSQYAKLILLSLIIYTATAIKDINQFLVYMCLTVVVGSLESATSMLIASLPLYISRSSLNAIDKHIPALSVVLSLTFVSFFLGKDSQIMTMLVYLSSIVILLQVIHSKIDKEEFFRYAVLAMAIVSTILLISFFTGELTFKFGRISLNDNIRQVANIIAIPAFFAWAILFDGGNKKYVYILVGLISSFVLLITISKGALIATTVGLVVVVISSSKKSWGRNLIFLIIAIPALYFIYQYTQTLDDLHMNRLNEEYDGFSGRTDIWSLYLSKMSESTTSVLFGFGPGDIKRLMYSDMYSHSLFLDMYFSYGVSMLILWIVVLFRILRMLFKAQEPIAIGFMIFTILLFATHGSVTYPIFYIQIGVVISMARQYGIQNQLAKSAM